ncbi:MAG: TfoX/Sxy family protein [Chloroflexi bacterium]|nr:TfoX/Sxy family protein [Chloroflexota bacterium]
MTAKELFDPLAEEMLLVPGTARASMFGGVALKSSNKVFACLYKDQLVVKLPGERVAELVRTGQAEPFDPGMGRVMKEWVAVEPRSEAEWRALITEARAFIEASR